MTADASRARAALGRPEVRAALREMGEDPEVVARYLASELADMRQKGLDRVREAEARLRRGPTPYTLNTRLRLYEPPPQMVARAALHRAIERHCDLSAHAAMLVADLGTWGEVAIDSSYEAALEELRRRGLAERRLPLARDPDQRTRAAPTPFVAEVFEQVRTLAMLDDEAQHLAPRSKSRRRS